jgi:uncharacterized damage-inducible protein DinB
MGWVAPEVERPDPPYAADERSMLEAWLDWHRQTLLGKCSGLSADQLKQRTCVPSSLSLLGLVRHMAEVERSWFQIRVAGRDVGHRYCSDDNPDGEFDDVEAADAESDFAAFAEDVAAARTVAAEHGLDDTFFHTHRRVDISLRWVYVHMIEEYARHNGHADLLRERIDGATGM